jgi:hypothetical protein
MNLLPDTQPQGIGKGSGYGQYHIPIEEIKPSACFYQYPDTRAVIRSIFKRITVTGSSNGGENRVSAHPSCAVMTRSALCFSSRSLINSALPKPIAL